MEAISGSRFAIPLTRLVSISTPCAIMVGRFSTTPLTKEEMICRTDSPTAGSAWIMPSIRFRSKSTPFCRMVGQFSTSAVANAVMI